VQGQRASALRFGDKPVQDLFAVLVVFSLQLRGFTNQEMRALLAHHKHLKSTNLLERLNEELKRRTLVVRIFPNAASCLRLSRALAIEMHENWIEATRYLNMDLSGEQQRDRPRLGVAA
jgi:transposase-like protein